MKQLNKSAILECLGKNIKRLRLLRGLSQENLADDLQKSVNFISLVENGKTGLSVQSLVDICNALNVDINSLFLDIVMTPKTDLDTFIINSLSSFNQEDKTIIADLVQYIVSSKK